MAVYPVIMCGGSGTRLWPASRPAQPKQFIPLVGDLSSFQATVMRVAGIEGVALPVIIAGVRHREMLEAQLSDIGQRATLLLEPAARDSAAAMAAAALWIFEQDQEGVAVFVSADHDIPDVPAFQAAVTQAAQTARLGRIVTLGVRPRFPSTAFGYIRPAATGDGVQAVSAFVEKPDEQRAKTYISEGYLWNSGNFVATASTLLGELRAHAPAVVDSVTQAVCEARAEGDVVVLGEAFSQCPKISIDYAVMEKTAKASVLPVSFAWADIGAWDAVHAASPRDELGNSAPSGALLQDTEGCLVRAPGNMQVAVIGARDLAIIVDDNAVLVCDLAQSQSVKSAGDKFRDAAAAPPFANLIEARRWFDSWLHVQVLPLWWSLGADHDGGGFREALDSDARPAETERRVRVPARQAFAYAACGAAGWNGPWKQAVAHGLEALTTQYLRQDGLYRSLASPAGEVMDDGATLYDQAFVLLALAAAEAAGLGSREPQALALLDRIEATFRAPKGFRENARHPYQSNALMHLFEASLAWSETGRDERWRQLARELADLAMTHLIDPTNGFIREVFDANWSPTTGPDACRVEPGHQFEWAWLLNRHDALFADAAAHAAAKRLFAIGLKGVHPSSGAAVNALDDEMKVLDGNARLWPQTEYLRAALTFNDASALPAAQMVARYLNNPAPGLWRDELLPDGTFRAGPSPASTLYHLVSAIGVLLA